MPLPVSPPWAGRVLVLVALSCLANSQASGALVNLITTARDDSTGGEIGAVSSNRWVESGFSYSSGNAPVTWDYESLYFTHWTSGGLTSNLVNRDAWGRSLTRATVLLLESTTLTARYLPATRDSDSDGLPDWYEIHYFGHLNHVGTDDPDGDGLDLLAEFGSGKHPLFPERHQAGGPSRAETGLLTYNQVAYPTYRITSLPAGLINQTATVAPGTVVGTPSLPHGSVTDFAYWTLDGVRQTDGWGRSLDQISFTMGTVDRAAVATFLAGDSDGDGVPDAWEARYYGTLARGADFDSDGDGIGLLEEYLAGSSPLFPNTTQAGGISYADSTLISVNFAGLSHYSLTSDPAGSVNQSGIVAPGTVVESPSISGDTFAGWTLDGVRQQDPWGVALRQFSFTVTATEHMGVATFLAGDSDGDGLPDAWEFFYLGTLAHDGASDPDGDGRALALEYASGSHPVFANTQQAGGISYANAAVVLNLQLFERLGQTLVGGVLSEVFSIDPHVLTGWNFGPDAAPAVGDWDGDGRADLFVVSRNALWVLRNRGEASVPDYELASAEFADFAALCASVEQPRLALGDWDGDGRADLVLGGSTSQIRGYVAQGDFATGQSLALAFTLDTGSTRSIPTFGDVNGDGRPDLVVALADGSVRAYLHNGSPLTPYADAPMPNVLPALVPNATGLACADVNGDGLADILVSDAAGRIWEFHRTGTGYFLRSQVWGGAGEGFASGLSLALVDLNGDGNIDALGGTTQGALVALRDPRVSAPVGLTLKRGGRSVLLGWTPSGQSRIRGFAVYRRDGDAPDFARLNTEPIPLNRYLDEALTRGVDYEYYVTSVSASYRPGNSEPVLVESEPSARIGHTMGNTTVRLHPRRDRTRGWLRVMLALESTRDLDGAAVELHLGYDPAVLTPISQLDAEEKTVRSSGLGQDLVLTDNAATADGELRITSTSGVLGQGQGNLFEVIFAVAAAADPAAPHGLVLAHAALRDTGGQPLLVDLTAPTLATLGAVPVLGDVTGDGVTDEADVVALTALLLGPDSAATPAELAAGDLNGDGTLGQADLVLLRRELAGLNHTE